MNPEFLTSFLFTIIISVAFALTLYHKKEDKDEEDRPRYFPDLSNTILPFFLIAFLLFGSFSESKGMPEPHPILSRDSER